MAYDHYILTAYGKADLIIVYDGYLVNHTKKQAINLKDYYEQVEQLPEGFAEISCSFASIWERADYCQKAFGLDDEQFILKNDRKERFEATALSFFLKRGKLYNIKVERHDQKISFKPIPR